MFKRLLVPLDGTILAEAVLPVAKSLAKQFNATIILFHAIERGAPNRIHGQRHITKPDEGSEYLNKIAENLTQAGVIVETDVHSTQSRDITQSIIDHIEDLKADIVLLCAHGHGGLRDFFLGNVAQQVIVHGKTPVLFVRTEEHKTEKPFECNKVLLPLDGTPAHEPAINYAVELAGACGKTIHLLTVVPTVGTLYAERAATRQLLPSTMNAVLDLAEQGAVSYLEDVIKQISNKGFQITAEVLRGDVASVILSTIDRLNIDAIVLATHGRTSTDAFWSASITPKVLAKSVKPVLLVKATGEEVR